MKRLSYILLSGLMLILSACEKDTESTNFAPVVTTGSASNIYRMGATLSGSIQLTETNTAKSYGILVSSFESMAEPTEYPVKDGSTSFNVLVQGLESGETYYYCAYASSGYSTAKSQVKSFTTTNSNAPVFNEVILQSKDEKSCVVSTELLDEGGSELLMTGFVWAEAGSGEPTIKSNVVNVEPQGSRMSATIKGMEPNKSYLVRAYGVNAQGVGYSNSISVTTNTATVPVLSDIIATDSTEVSVTVKSTIVDAGLGEVTKVGFCYSSESKNPTTDHLVVEEIHGSPESEYFAAIIEGLKPETTYYIRAYAINEKGTGYSEVFVFTTPEPTLIEGSEGDVNVAEAGGLNEFVDDTNKYNIIKLKISGYLNGDDIRLIREMAGRDVNGNETNGHLVDLDISEATIVEGGDYYYKIVDTGETFYTANNEIGKAMFASTILEKILLPNSIISIGDESFASCPDLATISIPSNVKSIGSFAFSGSISLTSIDIPYGITTLYGTFSGCSSLTTITIPETVTTIDYLAFQACVSLTKITIPDNVTLIGDGAFNLCNSLSEVEFGASSALTKIGIWAFRNTALTNVELPAGVTSIDDLAFNGCQSLAEVTSLATTPPTLGGSVFANIASPATLYVPTGCAPTYKASDWAQYFFTIKGEGEPENPGIYTLDDLIAFRDAVNNDADISQWVSNETYINLYADIDATSIDWKPIQNLPNGYCFEGNEHTISLKKTIVRYDDYEKWGLFYRNSGGFIQNLNIDLDMPLETTFTGSSKPVIDYAAICLFNGGNIVNCHVSIKNYADNYGVYFGGIVSSNLDTGFISQCSIAGTAIARGNVGGIAYMNQGFIIDCHSNLFIDANDGGDALAGIAAYNMGNGRIESCVNYAYILVSSTRKFYGVGGVVGRLFSGTVDNCQNKGNIEIPNTSALGGIVGNASETHVNYPNNATRIVTNCANTGDIVGPDGVTGNMIGVLDGADSEMTGCTYGGTVNGAAGTEANAIGKDLRSTSNDANINDIPTEEW